MNIIKKNKYELLAPAGNFECLIAAINAGADAVYFGLKDFNMRYSADNFSIKDLDKIRDICKKNNTRAYLAINTIIYDNELKKIESIIKKVKNKVDAIICWDIAVINLCRKYKIPFHISTQASVSNIEAAKFFKNLGAKSITLARELNLKQIKEISKIVPVCVFIHGAMCVSVSGRCFTSQFLHNRSANRGKCMHPCRKSYTVRDDEGNEVKVENNKIFSAKDLCTLPFIEKLKKIATSFKIEGRNKDPEYVDTTVRVYRKALDKKLSKQEIENGLKELKKVYNKGFSSGFFIKMPTADDLSKVDNSLATEKKEFIGKIVNYYAKPSVAAVYICSGSLEIGDEILIIGKKIGVKRHVIESMEIHKNPVQEVSKGQYVGIKVPKCSAGNKIYKITQI